MKGIENRVFGPPGTGKTTYISQQIRRAVESRGSDAVMVASFTRSAAVELAGRDLPINQNMLGTLHALCYRQMGSPTIAETKTEEFNQSQGLFTLNPMKANLDEPEMKYDADTDRIFAQYQVLRARMIDRAMWPADVLRFATAWERWKYENDYIDFTDMIENAIKFKISPPGNASIGFFDEVQDFTKLELTLVRQWAEQMDYAVLAGDDDQCIYTFKGATPSAFLNPVVPAEQVRVLAQSYRMPKSVHEYSQRWIAQVRARQPKEFKPRDSVGHVDARLEYRAKNPLELVRAAVALSEAGETCMIIGSCSYLLQPVIKELREEGELFHNPYRKTRGDWNPMAPGRRGTVTMRDRLAAFMRPSRAVYGDDAGNWTFEEMRRWLPLVKKTGVIKRGMAKLFESADDGLVSVELINRAFEDAAVMPILRSDLKWLRDNVATDKAKSIEYPLQIIERKGWPKFFDNPRIIVGTIHSVKGGEADTVFLLPDLSPAGLGEYLHATKVDTVRRMFYVGMTRAKENLILCGQSSPMAAKWLPK